MRTKTIQLNEIKLVQFLNKAERSHPKGQDKLRTKLIQLRCALSTVGILEVRDDVELNRILDIEDRIQELINRIQATLNQR